MFCNMFQVVKYKIDKKCLFFLYPSSTLVFLYVFFLIYQIHLENIQNVYEPLRAELLLLKCNVCVFFYRYSSIFEKATAAHRSVSEYTILISIVCLYGKHVLASPRFVNVHIYQNIVRYHTISRRLFRLCHVIHGKIPCVRQYFCNSYSQREPCVCVTLLISYSRLCFETTSVFVHRSLLHPVSFSFTRELKLRIREFLRFSFFYDLSLATVSKISWTIYASCLLIQVLASRANTFANLLAWRDIKYLLFESL